MAGDGQWEMPCSEAGAGAGSRLVQAALPSPLPAAVCVRSVVVEAQTPIPARLALLGSRHAGATSVGLLLPGLCSPRKCRSGAGLFQDGVPQPMPSSRSCLPIHPLPSPAHQPGPPPWAPSFEPVPLFPCPLPALQPLCRAPQLPEVLVPMQGGDF